MYSRFNLDSCGFISSYPASLLPQSSTSFWQKEQKRPTACHRWELPHRITTTLSLKLHFKPAKLTLVLKLLHLRLRSGDFRSTVEWHIRHGNYCPYLKKDIMALYTAFTWEKRCLVFLTDKKNNFISCETEVFTWHCYKCLSMCGMQTFAHFIWLHSCCWMRERILLRKQILQLRLCVILLIYMLSSEWWRVADKCPCQRSKHCKLVCERSSAFCIKERFDTSHRCCCRMSKKSEWGFPPTFLCEDVLLEI